MTHPGLCNPGKGSILGPKFARMTQKRGLQPQGIMTLIAFYSSAVTEVPTSLSWRVKVFVGDSPQGWRLK